MDPLTHCLVGGMAAKTIGTSKRRFWILMFLGGAPDLDVIFNLFGGWAYWLQHRGITHSILGVVIQAGLYSILFKKWDPGYFKTRYWHYLLPLSLHVLCDYMTSYGIPLLSPLTFADYSADLMVGISIVPIFFMTFGLIILYRKGTCGWQATRPLWAGWLLYLAMSVSGKAYASRLVEKVQDRVTTLPTVANPFQWAAVSEERVNNTYRLYNIDLFGGKAEVNNGFSMPENNYLIRASLRSSLVDEFLSQGRWPVARVFEEKGHWQVEWGQLLFSTRGAVRGKIRIEISEQGNVISEKKIFSFWTPSAS